MILSRSPDTRIVHRAVAELGAQPVVDGLQQARLRLHLAAAALHDTA
jgi:hypothetical protein